MIKKQNMKRLKLSSIEQNLKIYKNSLPPVDYY